MTASPDASRAGLNVVNVKARGAGRRQFGAGTCAIRRLLIGRGLFAETLYGAHSVPCEDCRRRAS